MQNGINRIMRTNEGNVNEVRVAPSSTAVNKLGGSFDLPAIYEFTSSLDSLQQEEPSFGGQKPTI